MKLFLFLIFATLSAHADKVTIVDTVAYDNNELKDINSGDLWTMIDGDGNVSQVKIKKSPSRGFSGKEPPSKDFSEISVPDSKNSPRILIRGLKITQDKIKFYEKTPFRETTPASPSAEKKEINYADTREVIIEYGEKGEKLIFTSTSIPQKVLSPDDSVDKFKLTVKYGKASQTLIDVDGASYVDGHPPYRFYWAADFNGDGIPDFIIRKEIHVSGAGVKILFLSEKVGDKIRFKRVAERYNGGC